MSKIVVLTVPGIQKLDFINELQRRTKSVELVVVQNPVKKTKTDRIKKFVHRVGYVDLLSELFYLFLSTRRQNQKALGIFKAFTGYNKSEELYEPRTLETTNVNGAEVLNTLQTIKPTVLVIWGGMIVSPEILQTAEKAVNIHMGLCPYYRGANGNMHAILNDELDKVGITIHFAVPKVDAGEIIDTFRLEGSPSEASFKKLNDTATEQYIGVIQALADGQTVMSEAQNLHEGRNYFLKEWTYKKAFLLAGKLRDYISSETS